MNHSQVGGLEDFREALLHRAFMRLNSLEDWLLPQVLAQQTKR